MLQWSVVVTLVTTGSLGLHRVQQVSSCLILCHVTSGVHSVAYAYPKVRLITTAVDPGVNEHFHIVPGIGKSSTVATSLVSWIVIVNFLFAIHEMCLYLQIFLWLTHLAFVCGRCYGHIT